MQGVYIPDMVHELTTQRLLTMEWVEGVRIRSAGEDPSVGRSLAREDMRLVGVSGFPLFPPTSRPLPSGSGAAFED